MTAKLLRNLQAEKYHLELNSQDIEQIKQNLGIKNPDITGFLVEVLEGDYGEVWLTEDNRPYELFAEYELVDNEYLEFDKEYYSKDADVEDENSADEED